MYRSNLIRVWLSAYCAYIAYVRYGYITIPYTIISIAAFKRYILGFRFNTAPFKVCRCCSETMKRSFVQTIFNAIIRSLSCLVGENVWWYQCDTVWKCLYVPIIPEEERKSYGMYDCMSNGKPYMRIQGCTRISHFLHMHWTGYPKLPHWIFSKPSNRWINYIIDMHPSHNDLIWVLRTHGSTVNMWLRLRASGGTASKPIGIKSILIACLYFHCTVIVLYMYCTS